ncbi:protein zwilch homolog isoform X1 [Ambystoma mexicanum]|uniref:protein zwilch homolog isoform X1 n=1 Tax=Ambystoma mexicanum TaxID=8296 RepID=UPI0037E8358B
MNTVEQLLSKPFLGLKHEEKLELKKLGPHQPDIKIEQLSIDRGKEYSRRFTRTWYDKKKWLCGCPSKKALFCFPCLLFGGETAWTKKGVSDLKHLSELIKKHELCQSHLNNSLRLVMYGRVNIATQLDEGYRVGVRKHNEEVDKNRYILSKLIDCIRFCGAFELALRGHDETDSSSNPGVFSGLVDFVSSIDSAMETHLKTAAAFKGSSRTIQKELLDCMLDIIREFIVKQLKSAEYVAVQVEDTTDVSTKAQSALVFRYIDGNGKVVERFYCFMHVKNPCVTTIAKALIDQLNNVFPEECDKGRVIAQSYDGASAMHETSAELQGKVRDVYPNAHYVHGYAHELTLIMEQAVSKISQVRSFFRDLSGFPSFFLHYPQMTKVLADMVAKRIPGGAAVRWDASPTVNTVYVYRKDLLKSFWAIENCGYFETPAICEARALIRMLQDKEFIFFLYLFHDLMPHVDMLYSQLRKWDIDTTHVAIATTDFITCINNVRGSVQDLSSRLPEESRFLNNVTEIETLNQVAKKVCDVFIIHAKKRFAFTKHLVTAKLLQSDLFERYERSFPVDVLADAVDAYPMLIKDRLRTELALMYGRPEFRRASSAVALFRFFIENNLQETFSETVKLLRILITTPMTTSESERCFTTLKSIKTFLRNTMKQDGLNALAMLSMEKQLIQDIPDFNKQTIEKFAALKDRQATFLYK